MKSIELINENIRDSLLKASGNYLRSGLDKFHVLEKKGTTDFQTPIGNMAIALELMLKAILSNKSALLIFTNVPDETRVKVFADISLTNREANELKNFNYKTIEFDKSFSLSSIIYPEIKNELKPLFSLISNVRNKAVHGAIPVTNKFYLYRIIYLIISIAEIMSKDDLIDLEFFSKKELELKTQIDTEKIDELKKRIKKAEEKSKIIDYTTIVLEDAFFDQLTHNCPICDCAGQLIGESEIVGEKIKQLIFIPSGFECSECGLQLLDKTEMKYMQLDGGIYRSEDLFKFMRENGNEE